MDAQKEAQRATTMKNYYLRPKVSLILLIVSAFNLIQFSCQTTSEDVEKLDCRLLKSLHEQQLKSIQQQQQTTDLTQTRQSNRNTSNRQQREFTGNSQPQPQQAHLLHQSNSRLQQQQQQQQPQQQQPETKLQHYQQHELNEQQEFSLALAPTSNFGSQQSQPARLESQQSSGTNKSQPDVSSVDTTPANVPIGTQQASALQAPSSSTTSSSLTSDSARAAIPGSLSASPPTTLEPAQSSNTSSVEESSQSRGHSRMQHVNQQQQQDSQTQASEDVIAAPSGGFAKRMGLQPISSHPSSISVITPISGPNVATNRQASEQGIVAANVNSFQLQQQQQQVVKPLFVVGKPISEQDYNHVLSNQQPSSTESALTPQTSSPLAGNGSGVQRIRVPKTNSEQALEPTHISSELPSSSEAPINELDLAGVDRMSGPAMVYTDGKLAPVLPSQSGNVTGSGSPEVQKQQLPLQTTPLTPLTPRLFQQTPSTAGAAVLSSTPRRPSLPPPVSHANAASGLRSPLSPSGPLLASQPIGGLTPPVNVALSGQSALSTAPIQMQSQGNSNPPFYQTSPPYMSSTNSPSNQANGNNQLQAQSANNYNRNYLAYGPSQQQMAATQERQANSQLVVGSGGSNGASAEKRPLNITRVEHISAECSNDLIRAVILFNGTFRGIIYSSTYVNDPNCLYVNGTGSSRYEFSIRLNQCGTLGKEQLHQPSSPGEARRRDQVMWSPITIQYNSIIEQEWDEHFRVSCEYGSDFWKTVSFSPFKVETNTGSPVVFTIDPPQCQMDIMLGHGLGPKIAVDGPVTVGDPLTLLIHMKSEKSGYDILVKNCVAHNGGKQRMQLIDASGCVVNQRFISPFRGTYNDNDMRHVTLYAYLKAFRFTGTPVLYLECEIHMCQSACPPQHCYWRRISKRSVNEFDYEYTLNSTSSEQKDSEHQQPLISDSLSLFKALQVRHEPQDRSERRAKSAQASGWRASDVFGESASSGQHLDGQAPLVCYRYAEVLLFQATAAGLLMVFVCIALTCCWRLRSFSSSAKEKRQVLMGNQRLLNSPSLLSISDAPSTCSGHSSALLTPIATFFRPEPLGKQSGASGKQGPPQNRRQAGSPIYQRPAPKQPAPLPVAHWANQIHKQQANFARHP